ncbi:hypothetical protein DFH11DRAFT_1168281 [Phellopilus nigrolimitatus]|nr:hypothetical protein DFH11DRAFT_1167816 [Phellopilus nigrolimitatus]KAH8107612.1 hypothetical protein DFH11DRAFT_1168281 [Phellopilus nigrolimitatus]
MPSSQLPGNPDVPLVPVASSDCNFVSILFSTAQILAGATVGQSYNSPHDNRPNDNPLHDTGILVDEFFHRTEEFTASDCIDPALLMLNPATTASIGSQEVVEAGGVLELGRNSNYNQWDLYPGPDTLPAMLPAERAYPTPPSESPPSNPQASHQQISLSRSIGPLYPPHQDYRPTSFTLPAVPGFLPSGNSSEAHNMPEFVQGSSSGAAAANAPRSSKAGPSRTQKSTKAARKSKAKNTAKAVRLTSTSPYGVPEDAFGMPEPRAPTASYQDHRPTPFALPTVPDFPAAGNVFQADNMPEFVQGSSSGTSAASPSRSSKAGPSRTDKKTKAARASKARPSKNKHTAKAARQAAANAYGVSEAAFRKTEPRVHQDPALNTFTLPAAPGFPASGNDVQAYVWPDFIQGSSRGAVANTRANEAGPSRTEKTTKAARANKARPPKAKNIAKAAPQAAASPSEKPEGPRFHCDYPGCEASCAHRSDLTRHKARCPRGPGGGASGRVKCVYCDLTYSRFDAMQRHCREDHPGSVVPIKERERGKGKKK